MTSQKDIGDHHTVIFLSKEELSQPSTIKLPEPEKPKGLILDDGSINWDCPCLGGMVAGPCGVPFRQAFSCFHYSEAEPKGSDCIEAFSKMQECMQNFPKLYGPSESDENDVFGVPQSEKEIEQSGIASDSNQKLNTADGNHKQSSINSSENMLEKNKM